MYRLVKLAMKSENSSKTIYSEFTISSLSYPLFVVLNKHDHFEVQKRESIITTTLIIT